MIIDQKPLSLNMAFLTTLSQPVQHILTLSSTVCKEKQDFRICSCKSLFSIYFLYIYNFPSFLFVPFVLSIRQLYTFVQLLIGNQRD